MDKIYKLISRRKLIVATVFLVILIGASYTYSKSTKANTLSENFHEELKEGNYNEALEIYNNAKKDNIIMKNFKLENKLKQHITDELSKNEKEFIDEKLSYEDSKGKVDSLNNLELIEDKIYEDTINKLNDIKIFREEYIDGENLFNKKDYEGALNKLSNTVEEDKLYTEKALKLRNEAEKAFKEELNLKIESLEKAYKYDEEITLLEKNKEFFEEQLLDNKLKEIEEKNNKYKSEVEALRGELVKEVENLENEDLKACASKYVPSPEIENFINNSEIGSGSRFFIWVNIKDQKTNIFVGKKGHWKLIKEWDSSTGAPGKATPSGVFSVKDRGEWFFSSKYSQGGKYWVQFMGNYLFHSLPMDMNRNVVDTTLGTPASHGCIRLAIENSKWIYENIPDGTTVYIK